MTETVLLVQSGQVRSTAEEEGTQHLTNVLHTMKQPSPLLPYQSTFTHCMQNSTHRMQVGRD